MNNAMNGTLQESRSWEDWSADLAAAAFGDREDPPPRQAQNHHGPAAEAGASPCGVSVPSFLQALLGIDFVPFVPSHLPSDQPEEDDINEEHEQQDETTAASSNNKDLNTGDLTATSFDEEELSIVGLMLEDEEEDGPSRATIRSMAEDIFTPKSDNAGAAALVLNIDDRTTLVASTGKSSNGKSKTPRRMPSLIQSLRRRRVKTPSSGGGATAAGSNSKSRRLLLRSSKSMPCDYDFSDDHTPKRMGRTTPTANTVAEEDSFLATIQTQHRNLLMHQERLLKAQKESSLVKKQASEIETRISDLHKQTLALQKALEGSILKLEQETEALQSTKIRISHLDQEAENAMQCLEETLKALRTKSTSSSIEADDFSFEPMIDSTDKPSLMSRRRASTDDNDLTAKQNTMESPPFLLSADLLSAESPLRSRANTAPTRPMSTCSSFMRINDLGVVTDDSSISSSHHSNIAAASPALETTNSNSNKHHYRKPSAAAQADFFFLDQNVSMILDKLFALGYAVVTDESDRFTPTRDTKYLLKNNRGAAESDWPLHPWYAATGTDVLTWVGGVDHNGFGHDWPVVKARGIVEASPRALLDFLLDSSKTGLYNKMSQGREDILILQAGVDTTADESEYGFAGDAKIMRALVKPKMLPKTIEMLSLWYSKPLPNAPPGSYMIVNRSVWEDGQGVTSQSSTNQSNNHNMLRCEMLLGVQLLRPVGRDHCELTTITHAFSPGVPEYMAKKFAPSNATSLLREIQEVFRGSSPPS